MRKSWASCWPFGGVLLTCAGFAQSLGLLGIRVDHPNLVGEAWDTALWADRPVVLEFVVDPAVPPIPPHATFEQIENFALSVLKGDSDG